MRTGALSNYFNSLFNLLFKEMTGQLSNINLEALPGCWEEMECGMIYAILHNDLWNILVRTLTREHFMNRCF